MKDNIESVTSRLINDLNVFERHQGHSTPNELKSKDQAINEVKVVKLAAKVAKGHFTSAGDELRSYHSVETKECAYEHCKVRFEGPKQKLYHHPTCRKYQSQLNLGLGKDNKPLKK